MKTNGFWGGCRLAGTAVRLRSYAIVMFLALSVLISCSAGGGSMTAGGLEGRWLGPAAGRNSYQAVVYPASRPLPVVISARINKSQEGSDE